MTVTDIVVLRSRGAGGTSALGISFAINLWITRVVRESCRSS